MDVVTLIGIGVGLLILLAVLFIFFYLPKRREKNKPVVKRVENEINLQTLRKIIKNPESTTKELKDAVDIVIEKYGNISKKVQFQISPEFDVYYEMMYMLCANPNTNKNIILYFDKELSRRNPDYKQEIAEAMQKGLSSR